VPEFGALEVLDRGRYADRGPGDREGAPVTVTAHQAIQDRDVGSVGTTEGTSITINFFWQVIDERYLVGHLTSWFSAEGSTCNVYRSYDLTYAG
jgi:hypothetical protein